MNYKINMLNVNVTSMFLSFSLIRKSKFKLVKKMKENNANNSSENIFAVSFKVQVKKQNRQ
ncbi:hypothetical protein HBE96_19645 [Clostridium sp. P21]|uniref:Uncharacterized protein n=1 Tax=Clostridium muellerianum TaxID=2716538 RepID=A0A7Y0EJW7_9CLOT|nr:hypothetical protein [Clostridium muellerianum]NMM64819.1 hypothetical protein [Clostridium muellerianum]